MKYLKTISLMALLVVVAACGNQKKFEKSPIDIMVKKLTDDKVKPFTILLYDMEEKGSFSKSYHHQYKIITHLPDSTAREDTTQWYEVSKSFFALHENDMGMEVASMNDEGVLSKTVAPPGYGNYVGNSRYGHWQTDASGHSFWAFYGKYMFFSSMFHMLAYPAYRSHYGDYRSNYYGRNRGYYGPKTSNGQSTYGTYSKYNQTTSKSSKYTSSGNFKQKVQSRTQRSTGRYGRSSRSRGGGFGK
ncbi:hypothetical protein KFE98_13755 [bacterium SCSIO 12741]|nr:hypothetical protein KFE98_13755 [bacterium SCSIO 12741]